jgi:hypothetical protein
VDDLRAAVQRKSDLAGKVAAAAAAKGPAGGAVGEQQTSEANEAAARGSGQDSPGEPLKLETETATAAAAKDLARSMLGGEAPRQRVDVAAQDERLADRALVGRDVALGADARKAAAQAAVTATAGAAADAAGTSSGFGAPNKAPPAADDPRAAVQRTYDSAAAAAAAKGSEHGALCEQQASEANGAAAGVIPSVLSF